MQFRSAPVAIPSPKGVRRVRHALTGIFAGAQAALADGWTD
jgi:hypothetical protein